jgi:hypothetical protein
MRYGWFRVALVVAFVSTTAHAAHAGAIFLDDVFANGNWTASILVDTQPSTTDPTFSAAQVGSGGVGNSAYRQTSHTYGPNNGSTGSAGLVVGHLGVPFVYDPATDGAITSIDLAFSANAFSVGNSGSIGYGALLLQNGSYYSAGFFNVILNSWTPFLLPNLTASSFGLVSGGGPGNPNFSAAGAPITFGYFTSNGTGLGGSQTSTLSGIDNYSLTVTSSATVPDETATLPLLALGLAGLVLTGAYRFN